MFKRDMVVCIRASGTSDTPIVLPVADESIDISTKAIVTTSTRNTLGNTEFTDLTVNRGIQETTLKFTTYIKPYKDTNVMLPDDLLHESLLGSIATDTVQLCTTATNTQDMKKFDLFLIYRDTKTTFSLLNAVSMSADYTFDLEGISRIKWTVVGVDFKQDTYLAYTYPIEGIHIINKWTQSRIDFPTLSSSYNLAATNFILSIKNTITFPYTEVVTERFTRPTDVPVISKRDITGKMSMYLKILTLEMYNDLIISLEQSSYLDTAANFEAIIGPCGGTDNIKFTLDNVILKYPKIKADEVVNLDIEFKGTSAVICYKE